MKPLENNENDLEDGKLDKDREKQHEVTGCLKYTIKLYCLALHIAFPHAT